MESIITQYINAYADPQLNYGENFAQDLSQLVVSKFSLLEFVQALGPSLTSDDNTQRAGSLGCLAATLHFLPPSKLLRQDVNVMVDFFTEKITDNPSLKYVFRGLYALVSSSHLTKTHVTKILHLLLKYEPTQHLAKVRYEPFTILRQILDLHLALVGQDRLFIKVFLHIATGEKDPKNLLISFELSESINSVFQFDIAHEDDKYFIAELFDNCFCYFPILFKPPPNDPYKITSDDLKLLLRNALTSQDLFAQDLLHNLFEKLTSTNPTVRNDVLTVLLLAINKFSVQTIEQFWETIWNGLKYEILHLDNLNMFDPAGSNLSPQPLSDYESIHLTLHVLNTLTIKVDHVILPTIMNDLTLNLSVGHKSFKACVVLLANLASILPYTFNYIIKIMFKPEYLGKFIETTDDEDIEITIAKQRDLVDSFGFIFIAFSMIKVAPSDSFYETNELLGVKNNLIIFMGQVMQGSSNVENALKVKVVLQYIKLLEINLLTIDEKTSIMNLLNDLFISSDPHSIIATSILDGFVRLLKHDNDQTTKMVVEAFLPLLLSKLDANDIEVFGIFEKLVVNFQLLEVLSIRLINRLGTNVLYNYKIIELIIKLIYKVQNIQQFLMNSWYKTFVPQLMKSITTDPDNIEIYSELIGIIVKYNDVSKHQAILNQTLEIFYNGVAGLNLPGYKLLQVPQNTIITCTKVLASIDKSVEFPKTHLQVQTLTDFVSLLSTNKLGYLQHLCLLVNKFGYDPETLDLQYTNLKVFEAQIWIVKGLLLKLHKLGMQKLGELLKNSANLNSKSYLLTFDILFKDINIFTANKELSKGTRIISNVNHTNVKLLHKQQIFNVVLDHIIDQETFVSLNLLAVVTKNVNSNIVRLNITRILPLVLKSINYQDLLESTLANLEIIIDAETDLTNNLPFLFKRLVETANVSNETVKYRSLNCLLKLIRLNKAEVLLYKQEILAGIVNNLDDPRRSVRKLTCDIRQELFELRSNV